MNKFNLKIGISFFLVFLWMVFIFLLSAQDGTASGELSGGITDLLVDFLRKILPNSIFKSLDWHFLMRKSAHFFGYFILSFLILNATVSINFPKKKAIIVTLPLSVLYAISDEVHQMFVPGRGPAVKDVLIDSCGAILGIITYLLLTKLCRKKNQS